MSSIRLLNHNHTRTAPWTLYDRTFGILTGTVFYARSDFFRFLPLFQVLLEFLQALPGCPQRVQIFAECKADVILPQSHVFFAIELVQTS